MKIAILKDDSEKVEHIFTAIDQVFKTGPQIYLFNLFHHLQICGESFDLVITDLSVKDAGRDAIIGYLAGQGNYLTQAVLLFETQSIEHEKLSRIGELPVILYQAEDDLEIAMRQIGQHIVPMSHINFESDPLANRWACTGL